MATQTKFYQFVEDLAHKVHNFSTDQVVVALCNAANPPLVTNSVLADLTEIAAYTGMSTRNVTRTSSTQTTGTYELILQDLTLTQTGSDSLAFQYIVFYNDTPTSPADPLISFVDYGSEIQLLDGEDLLIDMNQINGLFSVV